MEIGQYKIEGKAVLAPMAGITDMPFRQLCAENGAAMVTGEMTSSNPALRNTIKSTLRTALPNGPFQNKLPRIVQLAGTEPAELAQAARYQINLGAQILDINMGCPAKKVCRKAAGSALLQDEPLVERILKAVVAQAREYDVPVTLKIRTGQDPNNKNAPTIARIAEQAGIAALTVHGRTRACKFKGHAEYDTIASIVDSISIPVIANGDITDAEKARQVLKQTGASAIMVGRAARGKPWIFSEINTLLTNSQADCALFNGKSLNFHNAFTLERLIIKHLHMIDHFYSALNDEQLVQENGKSGSKSRAVIPAQVPVKIARKHICWYFDQLKHMMIKNNTMDCDTIPDACQPGSTNHQQKDLNLREYEGGTRDRSALAKIAAIITELDLARAKFNRLESHSAQLDFIRSTFRDLPTTGEIAA